MEKKQKIRKGEILGKNIKNHKLVTFTEIRSNLKLKRRKVSFRETLKNIYS